MRVFANLPVSSITDAVNVNECNRDLTIVVSKTPARFGLAPMEENRYLNRRLFGYPTTGDAVT